MIDLTGEEDESPVRASRLSFREVNGIIEFEDSPPPGQSSSIRTQATEPSAPSNIDPSQLSHSNSRSEATDDPMGLAEPQIKASPKPSEPPKKKTPEPAPQQSLTGLSTDTPRVESDSEDSEDQNTDQQRNVPGTPSKAASQEERSGKSPVSQVNTDSPLITHLREKKTRIKGQLPSVEDLVTALEGFKETMEDDHRTATYWKLHDAKLAIEDAPPSEFDEKTDPFASMTRAVYTQGDTLPPNSVKEYAEYLVRPPIRLSALANV